MLLRFLLYTFEVLRNTLNTKGMEARDSCNKRLAEDSTIRDSLSLGNFTINKPKEWALDEVELEIRDHDYDSTKINIDDLKVLRNYIDEILNSL